MLKFKNIPNPARFSNFEVNSPEWLVGFVVLDSTTL